MKNKDFEVLHELLRTAYKLISPTTYHDDLERLTPAFLKKDSEKRPGCYLTIDNGSDHTIFPICNRYGFKDPAMIKFSLKLAKKMANSDVARERDLTGHIVKLEKLLNKYSKETPLTNSQAVLKSKATRRFNMNMGLKQAINKKGKF